MKIWKYGITGVFLVLLSFYVPGCGSNLPKNVDTAYYPAAMIGNVMSARSFSSSLMTYSPDTDNVTFRTWIVTVSFTNKDYADPVVIDLFQFELITRDKIYSFSQWATLTPLVYIPRGETQNIVTCFVVPAGLKLEDARLKFTSEGKVSYGKLTGGGTIPGYDWQNQKVLKEKIKFLPVAGNQ